MSKLCFFYGTLKRGHYNNERFAGGLTYKHDTTVRGFSLVQANAYYPHAIPDTEGVVYGEVFEVDEQSAKSIDCMELGAGYRAIDVITDSGVKCTMYYSDDSYLKKLTPFSMFTGSRG